MKKSLSFFKGRQFQSISFSLLGFVVLLLFQNCGQDFGDDFNPSTVEEAFARDQLPFAFDFDIDQIGYMSCNGTAFEADSKFFTFKAGAFGDNTGVILRSNYRQIAESAGFTGAKMADALDISKRNSAAGLVLAIRDANNLQQTIGTSARTVGGMGFNRDLNLSLTQTDIAEQLVNTNTRINTFNLPGLSDSRTLDGRISFAVSEFDANLLRQRLSSNEFQLAVTFGTETGDNDEFPGQRARSPFDETGTLAESGNSVFGKSYNFEFFQFDPFRTGSASRAISRISRNTNLEDRSNLGEDWICPDDEKYIIVRPGDALRGYNGGGAIVKVNETGAAITENSFQFKIGSGTSIANGEAFIENVVCPMMPDDLSSNAEVINKWTRVRNMLPVKDWFVYRGVENGRAYNCIVPKSDESCYGEANQNTNPSIVVQYLRDETYPGIPSASRPVIETNCGPGTQKFCPHILSICHKR